MDSNVAIVGAAGFVGRELLKRLEELDIRATAVVRGAPELSVDGAFHVACSGSCERAGRRFDVVFSLAFPSGGKRHEHPALNAAIVDTVGGLIGDGGKLIQVSSLAVFGGALDRPVLVGAIAETRDSTYVESKVAAELAFVKQQAERGLSLDIVRLGNVWGRASGTWALPVVQRLLTGRPVGVSGARGFSNTTDVANVADYLAFLIRAGERGSGIRYHHLAEFSDVAWSEWVEPVAEAMKVEPVYADRSVLAAQASTRQEIMEALGPMHPRQLYKQLSGGRVTGSWSRTMVRRLPPTVRSRL